MREELENLLSCGDSWAEERAQLAIDFMNQYEAGDLNESEYKELMMDLVRTDAVDAAETNLQVKGILVAAVSGAVSMLG